MKTIQTKEQLCAFFDHTLLKASAKESDFITLCDEARENNFAMVAINSYPVSFCKNLLKGCNVHVGAAISFPLGQTTIATKIFEVQDAIKNGADEIDYVVNITELKRNNIDYLRQEMNEIVQICNNHSVISKVIFENCYLEKDEIDKLCKLALEVKPHFIKTSTGFGTSGATVDDVKRMKDAVGDAVKVKAAGGIRTWKECNAMIQAGAERIGTSNALKIIDEFLKTK